VDPDLHTDAPEGGAGLGEAVVDVGSQRVQRHATLAVPLLAAHLRAAQASAALHAHAERARLHRGLHGTLHGPAERHPAGQLVGPALREQCRVDLGLLDLLDVELDLRVAADLAEPFAEPLRFGAAPADHDPRPRRVHVDAQAIAGALDLDA